MALRSLSALKLGIKWQKSAHYVRSHCQVTRPSAACIYNVECNQELFCTFFEKHQVLTIDWRELVMQAIAKTVCAVLWDVGCSLCPVYFPLLTNAAMTTYVTGFLFSRSLCFGHIALLVKWLFLSGFEFQLALEIHLNASFPPPQETSQIFLSLHCPL